ncbi:unnamed protein product [Blepharisma stoltei]|uniref:Uncharacterized protein n=1 Tax=Blepharisma stoltei TaxID=1481888 RepID=A0AAU9IR09_9CILI|nr:unnamed protein product [Blepharisma stoltei]
MLIPELDQTKNIGAIGTCYSFNAAMLGIHTLNNLIQYGEDYTNPDVMNAAIRKQKIVGCSGKLKIAVDSNEPNDESISINNIIYNKTTGAWADNSVGFYEIGKNPLITIKGVIIWPNGTTINPNDKRLDQYDCAFDLHLLQKSKLGKMLYCLLIGILSLISLAFSLICLKASWKFKFPKIAHKRLAKFGDFVKHSYIVIDFTQFLALSPSFEWNYWNLTDILYAVIGDASKFTISQESSWTSIYLALGFIFLWFASCIFVCWDFDEKLAKLDFFLINYCIWAINQLLPFVANFGFIPIVMILFTLFKCENGSGNGITESYWEYDCKTYCWNDKHLAFAMISIFALIFFMISTVYFRPRWEFLYDDQNVVINPHYLVARGIFQIALVTLYLTLKNYSEALFGLAFIVIMSILLVYASVFEPSNHNVTNLWSRVSFFAIIWSAAISSIYWSNPNFKEDSIWIVMRLTGWALIALITLFIHLKVMENPLYTPKANNISLYFLFQFSSVVTARDISKNPEKKYIIVNKSTMIDTSHHFNASQQVDSMQHFCESQPIDSSQIDLSGIKI